MSLKSTVRAAIVGVTLGCLLVTALMAVAYIQLRTVQSEVTYANSVTDNVAKLNLLTSELLMSQSKRVVLQLQRQHDVLTAQLATPPRFDNRADLLANELAWRISKMGIFLDRLEKSLAQTRQIPGAGKDALDILFTAVITHSSALHSRSLEMREITSEKAATVQRTVFATIGGGFLAVIVGGGVLMSLLSHGLLARILKLRKVIREIGGGDLDADIPIADARTRWATCSANWITCG